MTNLKHGALKKGEPRALWYRAWEAAKRRCENPADQAFPNYGGRGIRMCDRWSWSAAAFLADMGEPPAGRTIERIDNERGYEPGNVRWATRTEQARNRRTSRRLELRGRVLSMAEWAEETGIPSSAIQGRLKQGWSVERALTEPNRGGAGSRGTPLAFRGESLPLRSWAKRFGIPYGTAKDRLASGKSLEEVLTTPVSKRGRGSPVWWENQAKKSGGTAG